MQNQKKVVSASQDDRKRQSHKGRLERRKQKPVKLSSKMANEQINTNQYIAQAVAEAARAAIETMSMAGIARAGNARPRMSGPIMKQLHLTGVQ